MFICLSSQGVLELILIDLGSNLVFLCLCFSEEGLSV